VTGRLTAERGPRGARGAQAVTVESTTVTSDRVPVVVVAGAGDSDGGPPTAGVARSHPFQRCSRLRRTTTLQEDTDRYRKNTLFRTGTTTPAFLMCCTDLKKAIL
jgi:hypothetical protein